MTTISVIVPTRDQARYLPQAIDSALGQTCPPLEVVVVDDGSTDETPAVLAAYGDRLRSLRQDNRGPAAARNAGIAASRGEVLAFLDADDLWEPRKLELQLARLAADPALGLVHCGYATFGEAREPGRVVLGGGEGWVSRQMLRLDRDGIAAPTSALLVPRRVLEDVGPFDERLLASEDWDLFYRIAVRYRVAYVAAPLVCYRQHGGGIHLDVPRLERSMLLALEKAFASPDPEVQRLRRRSYGRLHCILAGCYFHERQPRAFLRHAARSLAYDARNLLYFAAYPARLAGRAATAASRSWNLSRQARTE